MFSKEQARILLLATQGETFSLDKPVSGWEKEGGFFRQGETCSSLEEDRHH